MAEEYVVMLPFLAQGHFTRFLALAVQIEKIKGHKIVLVSTPKNVQKLKSSASSTLPPNTSITFVEIPFCGTDHGLPPDCENTSDGLYENIVKLVVGIQTLKPAFHQVIGDLVKEHGGKPPLCIIADGFYPWCGEVAHDFDTFFATYGPGAFAAASFSAMRMAYPAGEEPGFPQGQKVRLNMTSDTVMVGDQTFSELMRSAFRKSMGLADSYLINTAEKLEKSALVYLREKLKKPVFGVGPVLLQARGGARAGKQSSISLEDCRKWLDSKPPHSVLYISFGSENTLNASQMMQLAIALDHMDKNFVWVLRPPAGVDVNAEFKSEEWLPEGFEERTKESNKGLLIHKWAPQVEILSHKSTCAFLTHCGWNSIAEAFALGVPLLGWPMAGDQFHNSYYLEVEIGNGLELANGKNCEVTHEELRANIELAMSDSEKGKTMRVKAIEVKEIVKDALRCEEGFKGDSVKALEDFLETAASFRTKKTQVM